MLTITPRLRPRPGYRTLLALACATVLACAALAAGGPAPDSDGDGFPDAVELTGSDRLAFGDWFAAIAESQVYGINTDWAKVDQDCGGLLRYAFIEALKPHDAAWWKKFKRPPQVTQPRPQAYRWPTPVLSRSVFRDRPGPYQADDLQKGAMVGRIGVKFLYQFNTVFVSKDFRQAERGDLLFFFRKNGDRRYSRWHSMVYLGAKSTLAQQAFVAYHTGESQGRGQMRLVSLEQLQRFRDRDFRPLPENESFLGFFRWKILD
jgi:uncharacterized protein